MTFDTKPLGNFARVQGGFAFKSKDFKEKGIPVIKIKNVGQGSLKLSDISYVNDEVADSAGSYVTHAGDILISMTGSGPNQPGSLVGRVAYVKDFDAQCLINQRVGRLIFHNTDSIDGRFVFYAISSDRAQNFLVANSTGSANQANISGKMIERLPIPDVDIQTSRKIASVLGTLDDKIELNRQMNQTLEAMARAIFKSWFVDFDPVHAKANGAPYPLDAETMSLFPDRFVDSELGEIPEGWEVGRLGDDFTITMGQSPPGSTYNEDGDGLPFFQGRRDFGFRFPEKRVFCTQPKRFAKAGDTIVCVRAPVGDVNMARDKCCVGRGVTAVRHRTGSRSYTYYAMRSLRTVFDRFEAEGTVFGSLNKKDFHCLDFAIPPKELVHSFERLCYPIDQLIENSEHESRTLAELRDTLLPKLISGELRVPEAAAMAGAP